MAQNGFDKKRLPRFDHVQDTKAGPCCGCSGSQRRERSVAVFTEGERPRKHHEKRSAGELALASVSEIIAGFASEIEVATLVGMKTPGRLMGASSFEAGYGYRLVLPVVQY
jgi:hypothetical protein